jgi:hypothetical protein
MRKREAQAAIARIDSQVRMHLSKRHQSLLSPSIASAEIAFIKGELMSSKVVGKASLSLDGSMRSFSKTIRAGAWEWRTDQGKGSEETSLTTTILSDQYHHLSHHTHFRHLSTNQIGSSDDSCIFPLLSDSLLLTNLNKSSPLTRS